MGLTRSTITRAQIDEIQAMLDGGMEPEAIGDSIARIADLTELETLTVRSVAYDLRNGEKLRAADD